MVDVSYGNCSSVLTDHIWYFSSPNATLLSKPDRTKGPAGVVAIDLYMQLWTEEELMKAVHLLYIKLSENEICSRFLLYCSTALAIFESPDQYQLSLYDFFKDLTWFKTNLTQLLDESMDTISTKTSSYLIHFQPPKDLTLLLACHWASLKIRNDMATYVFKDLRAEIAIELTLLKAPTLKGLLYESMWFQYLVEATKHGGHCEHNVISVKQVGSAIMAAWQGP